MKDTHETCEHFRGDRRIDFIVVLVSERLALSKYVVYKPCDIILISLSLPETLLSAIIKALLI